MASERTQRRDHRERAISAAVNEEASYRFQTLHKAVLAYVEKHGLEHDGDKPQDDPLVAALEAALGAPLPPMVPASEIGEVVGFAQGMAEKVAEVEKLQKLCGELLSAVVWMSGSGDFAPGGQAHEGWLKLQKDDLLKRARETLRHEVWTANVKIDPGTEQFTRVREAMEATNGEPKAQS